METRATSKGQIVIPAILRRNMELEKAQEFIVLDNGDSIILKPMTDEYLKKLQGSLKGKDALRVLIDEDQR